MKKDETFYNIITIEDNNVLVEEKRIKFDRTHFDETMKNIEYPEKQEIYKSFLIKNLEKILSVHAEEQSKRLIYNNTILDITSPCLLKMTFRRNELVNLEQIK